MKNNTLILLLIVISFLIGLYYVLFTPIADIRAKIEALENYTPTPENIGVPRPTLPSQNQANQCPNILIQTGNTLSLYNSTQPKVVGQNPKIFNSLDEYVKYYNDQKKVGSVCPLLYLQKENNTQGKDVYRIQSVPTHLPGLAGSTVVVNNSAASSNNPMVTPVGTLLNNNANNVSTVLLKQSISVSADGTVVDDNDNIGGENSFDPYGQFNGVYTNVDAIHDQTEKQSISDNAMDPNWGGVDYTYQQINSGKYDDYAVSRPRLFNAASISFNPFLTNAAGPPVDIM